jgi:hypothetical protein
MVEASLFHCLAICLQKITHWVTRAVICGVGEMLCILYSILPMRARQFPGMLSTEQRRQRVAREGKAHLPSLPGRFAGSDEPIV